MKSGYAETKKWLLAAEEPWVRYNTLVDLMGADPTSAEVKTAYRALQKHPRISALMEALDPWPPTKPSKGAYYPQESIWKLQTLADFGLRKDDKRIAAIARRIFAAQAEDGGFLHGGFDHTHSWDTRPYICIAHVMTYALARFGYLDDPRLQRAYEQLSAWQRLDGGWHPNKNNLPGGKAEAELSCPFGTENVLRAMGVNPNMRDGQDAQRAAAYLLSCWERRAEPYRPVGFGIGTDWHKMQYPFVQYQLLKTVDTLSLIPSVHPDKRFGEMLDQLERKRDANDRWKAEGVNKIWSEFDFGQKKTPSPWITFVALRVLTRTRLNKRASRKQ